MSRRLTDLAEACSDAAALEVAGDRLAYAGILIDLAGRTRSVSPVLAMAAHATIHRRVERILAESSIPARLTLRNLAVIGASLILAALAAAGATTAGSDDGALISQRLAEQVRPRAAIALDPAALDEFAGYYALPWSPEFPFKVRRDGDRLLAGPIGLDAMELRPESDHDFFAVDGRAQQEFQVDGARRAAAVVLHQNGHEFTAIRLDDRIARGVGRPVICLKQS